MMARRFNRDGIRSFQQFLAATRSSGATLAPRELLEDDAVTERLDPELHIEPRQFARRGDAAHYLESVLRGRPERVVAADAGLWTWLTLYYFDEVCPFKAGRRVVKNDYSYVFEPNNSRHFYRHLLFISWHSLRLAGDYSRLYLSASLSTLDQVTAEVFNRLFLTRIPCIFEVLDRIYWDSERGSARRGIIGSPPKRGDLKNRFPLRIRQLEKTYDLMSLRAEQLIELLGDEFRQEAPEAWTPPSVPAGRKTPPSAAPVSKPQVVERFVSRSVSEPVQDGPSSATVSQIEPPMAAGRNRKAERPTTDRPDAPSQDPSQMHGIDSQKAAKRLTSSITLDDVDPQRISAQSWHLLAQWGETKEKLPRFDQRFARAQAPRVRKGRPATKNQLEICLRILRKAAKAGFDLSLLEFADGGSGEAGAPPNPSLKPTRSDDEVAKIFAQNPDLRELQEVFSEIEGILVRPDGTGECVFNVYVSGCVGPRESFLRVFDSTTRDSVQAYVWWQHSSAPEDCRRVWSRAVKNSRNQDGSYLVDGVSIREAAALSAQYADLAK